MNNILKRSLLCLAAALVAAEASFAGSPKPQEISLLLETGQAETAGKLITGLPEEQKSYWQGQSYFFAGDYEAAAREIGAAARSKNGKPEWEHLQRYYAALAEVHRDMQEYTSEHFRFRAAGADTILAPYALEALEKAYTEIGKDLGYYPGEKVLVEVFARKEEFSLASTLSDEILEKSGTVGICKFNRLMLLSPQSLPLGYRWLDTLCHEYTHFAVNRISRGKCPLWLHEGIARYHDTRWRLDEPLYMTAAGETQICKALKSDTLVPFGRMAPSLVYLKNQDEISLAFAEVSVAIRFLQEKFGHAALNTLLQALVTENENNAFKRATGLSTGKFEGEWKKYLRMLPLAESPGVLNDQVQFARKQEDDFIGADQRGQVRLGDDLRRIGRMDAALVHYEKALAAEPANPVILLKAARALIALGETQKAEQKLEEAVRKNPNYVTPYQALGELYMKAQNYGKAAAAYTEALAINPYHPATHRDLSRCYLALNKPQEAHRELQITAILDPSDAETRVILERLKAESRE